MSNDVWMWFLVGMVVTLAVVIGLTIGNWINDGAVIGRGEGHVIDMRPGQSMPVQCQMWKYTDPVQYQLWGCHD